MTSITFDSLRYARFGSGAEAGVPEPQADVQAELMAEAFGFYAVNILTRDHFAAGAGRQTGCALWAAGCEV